MIQWVGRVADWLIDLAGKMPTTNVRIGASILAFILIIAVWLVLAIAHAVFPDIAAWTPEWEMLTFVTVWAGLDIAQFSVKRVTTTKPAAPTSPPAATT